MCIRDRKYPNITVASGTSGTGGGFEKMIAGETDFANASRPIKDEEKAKLKEKNIDYSEFKIAQDGVTVAVNKENTFVDQLTREDLKAIYSGEAKTWKDINSSWPNEDIKAYSPDQSHGTFDFFTEEVMEKGDIKAEKNADTNVVVQSVEKDKNSIGYFGYNFYEANKDKLKVVPISEERGKAVEPTASTIQDESYPLSRPLFIYAKNEAVKDNEAVKTFLSFIFKDEGATVESTGYVKLPKKDYKDQLNKLEDIK